MNTTAPDNSTTSRSLARRLATYGRACRRHARRRPLAALMAVLLTVLALSLPIGWLIAAWRADRELPVAFFSDEPLIVEVTSRDSPAAAARLVAVPSLEPVLLAPGEYRLRMVGVGRLGGTLDVTVDHTSHDFALPAGDGRYRESTSGEHLPGVVDLGAERAFAQFGEEGLTLRSARPGVDERVESSELWRLPLGRSTGPELAASGWNWRRWRRDSADDFSMGRPELPVPHVVSQFVDLDDDGIGDVICGARHRAWILAASGASGRLLWFVTRGDIPDANAKEESVPIGAVLEPPLVVGDVDGDGVSDLLTSFVARRPKPTSNESAEVVDEGPLAEPRHAADFVRTIELLSGKSGRPVWEFSVPRNWFSQLLGLGGAASKEASLELLSWRGLAPVGRCFPLELVTWEKELHVAATSPAGALLLNLKTGRETAPFLPFEHLPAAAPVWGDVDGDGRADVAWVGDATLPQGVRSHGVQIRSLADPERRWRAITPEGRFGQPLVVDLNDDGRCEVITNKAGTVLPGPVPSAPNRLLEHRQIECRSGPDGQSLWTCRWPTNEMGEDLLSTLSGPDIDGDGWRDLFIAWRTDRMDSVRMAAISGRDGRTIWTQPDLLSFIPWRAVWQTSPIAVRWWRAGLDGWPLLVLSQVPQEPGINDRPTEEFVVAVSSGTGRVAYQGRGIAQWAAADLDQDGFEELLTFQRKEHARFGSIHIRSGMVEAWRRHGDSAMPLEDLDSDQVSEVGVTSFERLSVASGSTGRARFSIGRLSDMSLIFGPDYFHFVRPRSPHDGTRRAERDQEASAPRDVASFDADQDGVPDLLIADTVDATGTPGALTQSAKARAFAGRDGRPLWIMDLPVQLEQVTAVDLTGDGRPELLWETTDEEVGTAELHVTSVGGRSPRWSLQTQGATSAYSSAAIHSFGLGCVDCDGDGLPDVVATAHQDRHDVLQWEARRGRDGTLLWTYEQPLRWPLVGAGQAASLGRLMLRDRGAVGGMQVVEFDGEAGPAILCWSTKVMTSDNSSSPGESNDTAQNKVDWHFTAIDPRTGTVRWEWTTPAVPWETLIPESFCVDVQPVRRAGRVAAVIVSRKYQPYAAWWLDASGAGRSISTSPAEKSEGRPEGISTWVDDVDQDGTDELTLTDFGSLTTYEGLPEARPRWRREFGDHDIERLLPVDERGAAEAPTWVVHFHRPRHRLEGIDGRDGRARWICPTPATEANFRGVLGATAPGRAPFLLFDGEPGIGAYQARLVESTDRSSADDSPSSVRTWQTAADPRILDDTWLTWGLSPQPPPPLEPRDPSWARPLPWAPQLFPDQSWVIWKTYPSSPAAAWRTGWALGQRGMLAGGLIILPGWCLLRIIRRRQFTLRQLFVLPAVVLLFMTLHKLPTPALEATFWFDESLAVVGAISMNIGMIYETLGVPVNFALILAVLYAPAFVCLGRWTAAIVSRRWRAAGVWCAAWLITTALLAGLLIVHDRHAQPWLDEEYYSPIGWSLIFANGFFVLSWLAPLAWPWSWFVAACRWLWRRVRKSS